MRKGYTLFLFLFFLIFFNQSIFAAATTNSPNSSAQKIAKAEPDTASTDENQNKSDETPEDKSKNNEQSSEEDLKPGEVQPKGYQFNDFIEMGGTVEFEIGSIRDYGKKRHTEFSVSAAELDFDISLVDWLSAYIAIEYDPPTDRLFNTPADDSPIDRFVLKEAHMTFGGTEEYPYFIKLGRFYIPFGLGSGAALGDTLSISDPLTIEIFETRKESIMIGKNWDGFRLAAYVYNRDNRFFHIQEYESDQFGATFGYSTPESDEYVFTAAIDYINSIFDTDGLLDAFPEALEEPPAPGLSAHVRYLKNGISLIAEVDGALKKTSFEQDDEHYGLTPSAWMIEGGYITEMYSKKVFGAVDFSESYNLDGAYSRRRVLVNIGIWLTDAILWGLEYAHDIDYSASNGGTGESTNSVITQFAVEF